MLAYHLCNIKLLPLPVKLHYQSLTNHAVDASKRELERAIQRNRYARCAINNGTYAKNLRILLDLALPESGFP